MTKQTDKDKNNTESLVDALESITELLAKSDSKLAAAKESIAAANSHIAPEHLPPKSTIHKQQQAELIENLETGQFEIPVLNDVVIPADEVESISNDLSKLMEQTPASINSKPFADLNTDDIFKQIDLLQEKLEKTMHNSLQESVKNIEAELLKTIHSETDKIREQVKKSLQ